MVGIIAVSHGPFCEGLKKSTEMIAGKIEQCDTVCLDEGENPDAFEKRLSQAIDKCDNGSGVLILADLKGGTPYNRALMLSWTKEIAIVCGANLPMLLAVAMSRTEASALDELSLLAEKEGKNNIGIIKYEKNSMEWCIWIIYC